MKYLEQIDEIKSHSWPRQDRRKFGDGVAHRVVGRLKAGRVFDVVKEDHLKLKKQKSNFHDGVWLKPWGMNGLKIEFQFVKSVFPHRQKYSIKSVFIKSQLCTYDAVPMVNSGDSG